MITHSSDSLQIPSQNKKKSKLQILKYCQKFKFWNLQGALYATHLPKLLDKMCKYEMDPTRTVGTTERTPDAGLMDERTNGRTDGCTEWNQNTPQQLRCVWGIIMTYFFPILSFSTKISYQNGMWWGKVMGKILTDLYQTLYYIWKYLSINEIDLDNNTGL